MRRFTSSTKIACLLLLTISLWTTRVSAQNNFTIKINEPAEGALITGPFVLRGETTVPVEKSLTLKISAVDGGAVLATAPVPVTGTPGQQGTFTLNLSFTVEADTPVVMEVSYSVNGAPVAAAQVHVTLRPPPKVIIITATPAPAGPVVVSPDQPVPDAQLAAIQLALAEYEGRVQLVTPIPLSVEDRSFTDQCLGQVRTSELCPPGQIDGKVVKLAYGKDIYTYYVSSNQARLSLTESSPVNQQGNGVVAKIFSDAMTATGVRLFVARRFEGPFNGLVRSRVDWDSGVVTIVYASDGNPVTVNVTEKAMLPDMVIPAPDTTKETINIGPTVVQVQTVNGQKSIMWVVQGTLITLSVPQEVSTADLATFANGFSAPGSTEPGQLSPYDRNQFDRLTMNLSEPTRSMEMARQALMSFMAVPRKGGLISINQKQFKDTCLELAREGEQNCTAAVTPGYIVGIADTELFRYYVSGNTIRLNRENSELVNKVSANDFASPEAAKTNLTFPIIVPTDPGLILLGIEVGLSNNVNSALLIYRDQKTKGVLALRENATNGGSPAAPLSQNGDKSTSEVFTATQPNGGSALISLWASPEIGAEDLSRIKASFVAK
jgi:hypothetical protein